MLNRRRWKNRVLHSHKHPTLAEKGFRARGLMALSFLLPLREAGIGQKIENGVVSHLRTEAGSSLCCTYLCSSKSF